MGSKGKTVTYKVTLNTPQSRACVVCERRVEVSSTDLYVLLLNNVDLWKMWIMIILVINQTVSRILRLWSPNVSVYCYSRCHSQWENAYVFQKAVFESTWYTLFDILYKVPSNSIPSSLLLVWLMTKPVHFFLHIFFKCKYQRPFP